MATLIVAPGGASSRASRATLVQHDAGAHNVLTLAMLYLRRGNLSAARRKATQALASIHGLQKAGAPAEPPCRLLQTGEWVRFNGKSQVFDDQMYAGQVGVVEFQCRDFAFADGRQVEIPGPVYVLIKAAGQRTPRSVAFHHESLEVVGHA